MDIDLDDLDEFWPPTSELVGLQFETDADFTRGQEIRWQHLGMFCLMNPDARYVVVPKTKVWRNPERRARQGGCTPGPVVVRRRDTRVSAAWRLGRAATSQ
jgi:hypothetical protein